VSLILLDLDSDWPSEIKMLERHIEGRSTWADRDVTYRRLEGWSVRQLTGELAASDRLGEFRHSLLRRLLELAKLAGA
jgi:hypothetical protein